MSVGRVSYQSNELLGCDIETQKKKVYSRLCLYLQIDIKAHKPLIEIPIDQQIE